MTHPTEQSDRERAEKALTKLADICCGIVDIEGNLFPEQITALSTEFAAIRREALLAAAKGVCYGCKCGWPLNGDGSRHTSTLTSPSAGCHAVAIRNLIDGGE